MSFTIGLVGKPSAGKSTFFKAATLAEVDIAAYPFTTIKPNVGTGYVRVPCADKFFGTQCNPRFGFCLDHTRFVPVEIIDVAGLVPGAHEGKGLGNQFLSDLNQADVLIHVVDASGSTDEKGEPIGVGNHDPAKDVRFLENEIDLWYASILWSNWKKLARSSSMTKQSIEELIAEQLSAMKVTETIALKAMDEADLKEQPEIWSEDDIKQLSTLLRKNTKPILVALNKIDVPEAKKNIERLKQEFPDTMFIPCSAELELALREAAKKEIISYIPGNKDFRILKKEVLSDKQIQGLGFIQKMLEENGNTGVQQILDSAVFDFLKYIAVFPGGINNLSDSKGNVLPDCFLMPPNSTAKAFAFAIHTDFGKHFLYAMDVKKKIRISGDQELEHGDVIEIINAAK
ncbi:MAG: redox-regulated ATPase YchF [Nanohaloarchaea archaeon]|nr:redox-regulated ATPase YchF [Candidatus Nanohaloarchaea archaeon]